MKNFLTKLDFIWQPMVAMFFMMLWCGYAVAQGEAPPLEEIATMEFMKALFASLGGLKGASSLGAAAMLVQLMMKFLKTPLGRKAGKYRLLAVSLMSMAAGVLALMLTSGMGLGAALMHGTTLAAFQVFAHQLWKQFVTKSAEEPKG